MLRPLLTCICFIVLLHAAAQDSSGLRLPAKYISETAEKAGMLEAKLDRKTSRALKRMQKQEQKIQRKLSRTDSLKARQLLNNTQQSYNQLQSRLSQTSGKLKKYIPDLDSMSSSLQFLQNHPDWLGQAAEWKGKATAALDNVKGLQQQFQKAEEVKTFLQQRRQYLKEQLQSLGLSKQLKKINKEVYYYQAQVQEYKELLKDHKKASRKALQLLGQTKLFKDFMRKHSQLAGLFRLPDAGGGATATASLAGLQTRAQVNSLIQNQLAAGGPNAQAQFSQNLQNAQAQLNQLKDKFLKGLGGGSTDIAMPEGFKPNNQKTKSFWKRIDLGTNFQSQRGNGILPVTSDIGISIGYKLNDKSIIGIGGSYKLGWGESIRKIKVSHQGMSIRSFADWKLKGSFWLTGGYEWNYRPGLTGVTLTDMAGAIRQLETWQQSGLIGISKQLSVKTKFFKQTKLQVLWDILSYRQVPRTPAVVFRVGYGF